MFAWNELLDVLESGEDVVLMVVLQSDGSSPGRQGFRMFVTRNGTMFGTIGGGIMEQKLVELAKSKFDEAPFPGFVRRQIHRSDEIKNRSGMICSGEQTVAFYYLRKDDASLIQIINSGEVSHLVLSERGISATSKGSSSEQFVFEQTSPDTWNFEQNLNWKPVAYIFGGGHVGLAMSRVLSQLGFYVVVLDNRAGLNTLEANSYADEKHIIDYQNAENHVTEGRNSYVIIMSFGYKTDEVIIRRLLGKNFRYLGLMGSQHKIDVLFENLRKDGYADVTLAEVHAPIGLPISSKTTEEIAISIAAEIIRVKNSE